MSKVAEVGAMAAAGLSPEDIVARTGLTPLTVKNYMSLAKNGRASNYKRKTVPPAAVSAASLGVLWSAAKARNLTYQDLAVALLEIIARDGLVGAILDDADG